MCLVLSSIKFLLKTTKAAPSFTSRHIWEHEKNIPIADQIGEPFVREKTNFLFRYSGLSLLEFFSFPQMYSPHLLMGWSINSVFGQISCDAEVFCAYASAFFFGASRASVSHFYPKNHYCFLHNVQLDKNLITQSSLLSYSCTKIPLFLNCGNIENIIPD